MLLSLSVLTTASYELVVGTDRRILKGGRFLLTASLGWYLYKGSPVARFFGVVMLTLGGIASLVGLMQRVGATPTTSLLLLIVVAGCYLGAAFLLAFSKDVSAHFKRASES